MVVSLPLLLAFSLTLLPLSRWPFFPSSVAVNSVARLLASLFRPFRRLSGGCNCKDTGGSAVAGVLLVYGIDGSSTLLNRRRFKGLLVVSIVSVLLLLFLGLLVLRLSVSFGRSSVLKRRTRSAFLSLGDALIPWLANSGRRSFTRSVHGLNSGDRYCDESIGSCQMGYS